jgi:hypothetical protein
MVAAPTVTAANAVGRILYSNGVAATIIVPKASVSITDAE